MFGENHFPLCRQTLQWFQRWWQWGEYCNGSSVFGDLKRFSSSDAAKVYTQILPQLPHPDSLSLLCHVA